MKRIKLNPASQAQIMSNNELHCIIGGSEGGGENLNSDIFYRIDCISKMYETSGCFYARYSTQATVSECMNRQLCQTSFDCEPKATQFSGDFPEGSGCPLNISGVLTN